MAKLMVVARVGMEWRVFVDLDFFFFNENRTSINHQNITVQVYVYPKLVPESIMMTHLLGRVADYLYIIKERKTYLLKCCNQILSCSFFFFPSNHEF